MQKEYPVDVGDLPPALIRSIKSVAEPVIGETLSVLCGARDYYRDPVNMQRVIDHALTGHIDRETWPLLYFAYLMTRGAPIAAERLEPLRKGLNQYREDNRDPLGQLLRDYMEDRVTVLASPTATDKPLQVREPLASYNERLRRRPEE